MAKKSGSMGTIKAELTIPTWKKIFIEVAIRSILDIHLNYCIWDIAQVELDTANMNKIYDGEGVYMAPEEVVTDSISQWFLKLGFFKTHPTDGEGRSYIIDRETQIKKKKGKGNNYDEIDLVLKRIQPTNSDGSDTIPTLIEAKRFQRLKINLEKGNRKLSKPQISLIETDIKKLQRIFKKVKTEQIRFFKNDFNSIYCNLLIWGKSGVIGKGSEITEETNLAQFIKEQLDDKYKAFIKENESIYRKIKIYSFKDNVDSTNSSFIWVALLELDFSGTT